jgi:hypothetical protein
MDPVVNEQTPDPADTLYEYFPLGLDDWMPPVDAVYRPHVVHHTGPIRKRASVAGAGGSSPAFVAFGRARSKRYFSADDGWVFLGARLVAFFLRIYLLGMEAGKVSCYSLVVVVLRTDGLHI